MTHTTKAANEGAPTSVYFPTFAALPGRLRARRRAAWQRSKNAWRRSRRTLAVLLLLAIAAHIATNIWASVLLNRELAAVRSQGAPLTMSELALPPVPDERNAAPLYRRAYKHMKRPQVSGVWGERSQPSRKLLQEDQEAIALTRQAAMLPECRFNTDWDKGVFALFPHLAELRNLAQLMATQAVQESRDGQLELALRDIQVIFRMSGHGAEEQILIGVLVSRAIESIGYQALGAVLQTNQINPRQARQIAQQLPQRDWPAAIAKSLRGERAMGIWSYDALRSNRLNLGEMFNFFGDGGQPGPLARLTNRPLMLLWSPLLKLDEVYYLRIMSRHINALPAKIAKAPSRLVPDPDREIEQLPIYVVMTRSVMPVYSRVWVTAKEAEVERGLAQAALAIIAYRSATGEYPLHLSEAATLWGSTLPPDPYSGRPFGYRGDKDSFLLYSVGEDKKDDGGKWDQRAVVYPGTDDITWPPGQRK